MAKIWGILRNCWICIRFPFLYPRNVWTGRHYSNRKLEKKQKEIYKKWSDWSKDHQELYYYEFGEDCLLDFNPAEDIFTPEDFSNSFVKCEYVMKLFSIPFKDKFLHWFYGFVNDFLQIFHFIPTYTLLGDIPLGWRKRFGIQFCKELKEAILKSGGRKLMRDFRITQIKEKWGQFQCYVQGSTETVDRVIRKYEYISQFICIECGEDAVKKTTWWISPYCDKHLPKNRRWLWIDPVYGWSNCARDDENKKIKEGWK